jgi:integrase
MSEHLTDAIVKRLKQPKRGNRITYDDTLAGFGCRVTAAGARAFILNYWTKAGRERRITIGKFPTWHTAAAREEAHRLKQLVDLGNDPLADIEAERAAPTMTDLIARFRAEHLPHKRASTADDYERMLRLHIGPHFGRHLKVADVRFEDVDALHRKITKSGTPYAANRTMAVVHRMFELAIRWRMRSDNPAKGIERNYEAKRKRYLSGDELARLSQALAEHPDKQAANIVRLLLLTGCRKGEACGARWADIDLGNGTWIKPGATTKQRTDHVVPLSAPARQLLSEIQREQISKHPKGLVGQFVFPSRRGDTGYRTELKRGLEAVMQGRQHRRPAHPRSSTFLRFTTRERGRALAYDRRAARSYATANDAQIRTSIRRSAAGRHREGRRYRHRRWQRAADQRAGEAPKAEGALGRDRQ